MSFAPMVLVVGLVTLLLQATGATPVGPTNQILAGTTIVKRADGTVDAEYRYRLVEPPAEAIAEGKKVPLIVFLHGAGERGDDNAAQLVHFVKRAAEPAFQSKAPCFILAVQCPKQEYWAAIDIEAMQKRGATPVFAKEPTRSMRAVMQAMDEVIATKAIDRSRIYLTGLSMGGFGSFDLAARRPELFAAVAPVCGGGDPGTASILASIPFFITHGDQDTIVPVALSRLMRDAIRDAAKTRSDAAVTKLPAEEIPMYREYANVGHNSWDYAYQWGPEGVLDWMFKQRRR